jgi:hypothetical protein
VFERALARRTALARASLCRTVVNALPVLSLALLLLAPSAAAGPTLERTGDGPECDLLLPGSESAALGDCLRCHADQASSHAGSRHPVGLDYARAHAAQRGHGLPLRSPEEAVRRGAFLPGGELRCTTCHERRSPWRYRLAIPPGASVRAAVDPRDPATYGPAPGRAAAPRPGDAVGTKPLCLLCHGLD